MEIINQQDSWTPGLKITADGIEAEQIIETAEQPAEVEPIHQKQKSNLLLGSSLRRAKKLLKLENFRNKKSVDRDPSPNEQMTIEPPEQWTTCRLRQNARELLVRKRISTVADAESKRIHRLNRNRNRKVCRRWIEPSLTLEQKRKAKARLIGNETEEQKSARLRLERKRRAGRRSEKRLESLRNAADTQPQQREFVNFVVEIIDKDQQAEQGYFEIGNSFPKKEDEECSIGEFTIGNFVPKDLLPGESIESTTERSKTTRDDTRIEKETKFDVVCNLLHSICRKDQNQDNTILQRFDNLCTSRNFNYILSIVAWHKLNGRTGDGTVNRFVNENWRL